MSLPVFVVESEGTPIESSVHALLETDAAFQCRRLSWEALRHTDWTRDNARGLVTVAVPHTAVTATAFQYLHDRPISVPTFAVLPSNVEESALRFIAESVDDFMLTPVRALELRHRLERVLGPVGSGADSVRERLLEEMAMTQLVGRDPAFLQAIGQVPRFAGSGKPVLITGETGTGKELCARAIHHLGPRRNGPFIAVDCGTIPDHLFENELFGHARGAFTDAHRDQRGLVTMAQGGTLFLDEVDTLSLAAQGKLLRLLQERSFRSLGADHFQQADINVIAATNRDLEASIDTKQFRSDLYFRLNVLRLELPPLRNRVTDIELLAVHFLDDIRATGEPGASSFSAAALRALALYHWPGNVRELVNVVQRAAITCDAPQLLPCHLGLPGVVETGEPSACFGAARAAAVAAFERRYIEEMLQRHAGNVTHAARAARKDRRVFGRLMKKYRIHRRVAP